MAMDATTREATGQWLKAAQSALALALASVEANVTGDMRASRDIDAAIEALALARSNVDGLSSAKRARFMVRVRKALGYTYP